MRLHIFPLFFCLPWFATTAAACEYCEKRIILSDDLAACYLEKFDDEIAQMEKSGLPAQLVNLSTCDGAETPTRAGSELPGAVAVAALPTLSFILDAPGMRCLAKALRVEKWDPDRIKSFEIRRDCTNEP